MPNKTLKKAIEIAVPYRVEENKSWEKRSRDEFLKDEIKIGMNKSQVWALWGRQDDINRTVSAYGIREQLIYGDTVLYFDNGELTSWQE